MTIQITPRVADMLREMLTDTDGLRIQERAMQKVLTFIIVHADDHMAAPEALDLIHAAHKVLDFYAALVTALADENVPSAGQAVTLSLQP